MCCFQLCAFTELLWLFRLFGGSIPIIRLFFFYFCGGKKSHCNFGRDCTESGDGCGHGKILSVQEHGHFSICLSCSVSFISILQFSGTDLSPIQLNLLISILLFGCYHDWNCFLCQIFFIFILISLLTHGFPVVCDLVSTCL